MCVKLAAAVRLQKNPYKMTTASTTEILLLKFLRGDFTIWLCEYDANANGWNAEAKIKKLAAFLQGETASHFYALDDDSRKSYTDTTHWRAYSFF